MKKLMMGIVLVLCIGVSVSPTTAATDLVEGHGFYDEITYLMEEGILKGYPDGTVRPESVVTRGEAAIMIGLMQNLDGTQRDSTFSDVTKGQKASGFIAEAQEAGYITGYPDGTFRPYDPITRGDMAIILSRVFPTPFSVTADFTDVSPNMKAYEAISEILSVNITVGYADNTFQPSTHVTRGQFAAFLARRLEPEFKNDARIPNSYMKDKMKTYTYNTATHGIETHTFKYADAKADEPIGYVWARHVPKIGETYLYGEVETRKNLIHAYPVVDLFDPPLLGYPIKVGTTHSILPSAAGKPLTPNDVTPTITAVGVTVETPYRTFTNAVEVTVEFGYKEYFVEGFAKVKTVNDYGTVFELINME